MADQADIAIGISNVCLSVAYLVGNESLLRRLIIIVSSRLRPRGFYAVGDTRYVRAIVSRDDRGLETASFNRARFTGRALASRAETSERRSEIAVRQSKMDDGILACISNAYIKEVLILSERSFVSPPQPSFPLSFLWTRVRVWNFPSGDMSKHSEKLAREESARITIRNCKESRRRRRHRGRAP